MKSTVWTCDQCGKQREITWESTGIPVGWLLWHRRSTRALSVPQRKEAFCSLECAAAGANRDTSQPPPPHTSSERVL